MAFDPIDDFYIFPKYSIKEAHVILIEFQCENRTKRTNQRIKKIEDNTKLVPGKTMANLLMWTKFPFTWPSHHRVNLVNIAG